MRPYMWCEHLYAHLALAGQGGAGWRPLVCTTRRPMIGIDVLIAPYPRHAPSGTVGSPQYKDGTSMAAPDPKNASRRLWQQAGDIYGESTLRVGNRLVLPV